MLAHASGDGLLTPSRASRAARGTRQMQCRSFATQGVSPTAEQQVKAWGARRAGGAESAGADSLLPLSMTTTTTHRARQMQQNIAVHSSRVLQTQAQARQELAVFRGGAAGLAATPNRHAISTRPRVTAAAAMQLHTAAYTSGISKFQPHRRGLATGRDVKGAMNRKGAISHGTVCDARSHDADAALVSAQKSLMQMQTTRSHWRGERAKATAARRKVRAGCRAGVRLRRGGVPQRFWAAQSASWRAWTARVHELHAVPGGFRAMRRRFKSPRR